jgi:ubiquitin-conjugating enzyme E2 variant
MAGSSGEVIIVPRNFQLLDELEKTEKGQTDMSISMGLSDGSDVLMREWVCTILGPNGGPLENRIISVHLTCGDDYPKVPPIAHFLTKVNAPDFVVSAFMAIAEPFLPCLRTTLEWRASPHRELLFMSRPADDDLLVLAPPCAARRRETAR